MVLSPTDAEFQGNLVLWPGSHLPLHECAEGPYGALDIPKLRRILGLAPIPDIPEDKKAEATELMRLRRQKRDQEQALIHCEQKRGGPCSALFPTEEKTQAGRRSTLSP